MHQAKTLGAFCILLLAVGLTYANHFDNDFHFDDSHTVVENPYLRDLGNIPHFFTDAGTFSSLPTNQSYRPMVSTSLALDYWLGGGLKPFYFHASTFLWFLVQLGLMYALFCRVLDAARRDPRNAVVALMATAWYGLHPAIAETVNYVIQRGDVYSTLGVIAGMVVYARVPRLRRYGLYLVPVAAALLSKPTAMVFPALLLVYMTLVEDEAPSRGLVQCLPAILVVVGSACLISAMTPATYDPGAVSASAYRITQPLVALRYFRSFFLPLHLSADTDLQPIHDIVDGWAWAGFLFLAALVAVAAHCCRRREQRPIAFGILWFLFALFPTSIFPLAEVENDHRMYFPFVGLALSVSWFLALCAEKWLPRHPVPTVAVAAVCGCLLAAYAWGTSQRNAVWRTEESLWYDVTLKSPRNGRGLMNYGLTQMAKGQNLRALEYFERAAIYTPAYPYLEMNLGIVKAALNQDDAATEHFTRAIALAPREARTYYYYARWLRQTGRWQEAAAELEQAIGVNDRYLEAHHLLMKIRAEQLDWPLLAQAAASTLAVFPSDATAAAFLAQAQAAAQPHRGSGRGAVH